MVWSNFLRTPILLGRWCNRALAVTTANRFQLVTYSGQQQQRFKSFKINCGQTLPKCGERFKQKPCASKQEKAALKQPAAKPLPPEKRAIHLKHPEICCGNPCPDAFPRFDTLYYRRTDKLNREYQQTWAECPELVKKPKIICCIDKVKFPKWKKRPRKLRPQTACKQSSCAGTSAKCPRVILPLCRRARIPPLCNHKRPKSDCKKRKTPFPAFSECERNRPKPLHPVECRCLMKPTMCEIWAYYHKMRKVKKVGLC